MSWRFELKVLTEHLRASFLMVGFLQLAQPSGSNKVIKLLDIYGAGMDF